MDQYFRMQLQVVIVPGWAATQSRETDLPSQSAECIVTHPGDQQESQKSLWCYLQRVSKARASLG